MSSSPLRIGLLGMGRAGGFHLQSLRVMDDATIDCIYDVDHQKARQMAERIGCHAAHDADEVIDRNEVDAVIVATPTDSHFEYVQQCLDAGKPVLSEKPLGKRLDQIDACFAKAAARSTPLFVAFQRRFDPSFSSLVEAVHARNIGRLQFVRSVSRDNPAPAADYIRISGGIFHDCMVHDLDMIMQIIGEKPTHMSSFGSSFIPEIGALGDYDNVVAALVWKAVPPRQSTSIAAASTDTINASKCLAMAACCKPITVT